MSWETINQVLGLATLDDDFCQELLKDPCAAIQKQGFRLTQEEENVLSWITAGTLPELTQMVFDRFAPGTADQRIDHNDEG